jgi:hypothetical protein
MTISKQINREMGFTLIQSWYPTTNMFQQSRASIKQWKDGETTASRNAQINPTAEIFDLS